MSEISFNNLNNKYRLVNPNLVFKNNPQEIPQTNIPQGIIPDVQTTLPQSQAPVQQQTPVVQIPDIYNTPVDDAPKSLKETIKQADMMGMVTPWFETPILMGATALGLSMGIDKFTEACGGEYEKSLLGKATALGDRIENSDFIKKDWVQKGLTKTKKGVGKANNLLNRSALIRAIRTTPAQPEWQMPKSEMISQQVRITEDLHSIVEKLHLKDNKLIEFKHLGLDKAEKEMLKKKFNVSRIAKINHSDLINYTLLKRLDLPESEIDKILAKGANALPEIKQKILKHIGFTIEELNDMHLNPDKYLNRVKDAMKKTGKKVKVGAGHYWFLGPLQLFERTISCDQIGNRLHSLMDKNISKTGKFFSKVIQKIHRGFTFGGGKLGMCLWIAPSIVMMLKDTVKADRDEKIGTVVNGSFEAISWVFTFPLSIATMYALAGMENAGLTPEQVKTFRELKNAFNEKVAKGEFIGNKALYKEELKALKSKLKAIKKSVPPQNLFTKIVKKVWSVLNMDLGMIKPYQGTNVATNLVRKIPNSLRNCFGVPLRFIICMFAVEGFYRKIIEKCSKTLFGRHYDHMKHEEHDAAKKTQKKHTKQDLQNRLYEAQAVKNGVFNNPEAKSQTSTSTSQSQTANEVNPVNIFEEKPINSENFPVNSSLENTTQPSSTNNSQKKSKIQNEINTNSKSQVKKDVKEKIDNYTYIPSSENVIKQQQEVLENKYIPSQEGVKFSKDFDNSHLANALSRADRAEQRALQVLNGNFNGF